MENSSQIMNAPLHRHTVKTKRTNLLQSVLCFSSVESEKASSSYNAALAFSATTANDAGSVYASSAKTFLSSSMLARDNPLMKRL
jgi:long-subunit fatty acid transport protein